MARRIVPELRTKIQRFFFFTPLAAMGPGTIGYLLPRLSSIAVSATGHQPGSGTRNVTCTRNCFIKFYTQVFAISV